jgi:hypothetical protein
VTFGIINPQGGLRKADALIKAHHPHSSRVTVMLETILGSAREAGLFLLPQFYLYISSRVIRVGVIASVCSCPFDELQRE